jgi:hypothetical protein
LVAGKPARPLMDDAISASGATRPLAVGDRLDTDIAGAVNVGIDSLLVLSGVSTPADLLAAAPDERPSYVADDLRAVQHPADDLKIKAHPDWLVDDQLRLRHQGSNPDPLDALRALCAAWWPHHNGPAEVQPQDDAARAAVAALKL